MAMLSILRCGIKTTKMSAMFLFIMAVGTTLLSLTWAMLLSTAL